MPIVDGAHNPNIATGFVVAIWGFVLAALLTNAGTSLGWGFIGNFIAILGEVTRLLLPVFAIAGAIGMMMNFGSKLGFALNDRLEGSAIRAVNLPLAAAAGAIIAMMIGAIINWLSADDVATVAPIVHAQGEGKEITARIFVCPNPDAETVRAQAKRAIAAYLNVPVYAAFHQWLGREQLQGMWDHWAAGDRKAALDAIPDSVVDEIIVHGSPEECREHIQRYVDNGVDTPMLGILPLGVDTREAARALARG